MAKRTTKKPTTRRKKVTEAEFEVSVKDETPGAQTPEKSATVNAMDAEKAVDTVTQGTGNDADVVTVTKKKPGAPDTGSAGGGVHATESLSMKAITEAVSFPYSVSLPVQFRKFLDESSIGYVEVGNTMLIRFDDKKALTETLRVLKKSDNDKARVIYGGISRSVS